MRQAGEILLSITFTNNEERAVITPETAKQFLYAVKLPRVASKGLRTESSLIDYDEQKHQAMGVGSEIVSFVKGVCRR